jgi:beta-lactamase class A
MRFKLAIFTLLLMMFALSRSLVGAQTSDPTTSPEPEETESAPLAMPTDLPVDLPDEVALLWRQVMAQPKDFSVACMPLRSTGQTVIFGTDVFPLASVSKLLVFIEYAIRVDAGDIPLDEMVRVDDLERYNLPRTDRGAHDRFLQTYPEGTTVLPLWDVATEGMIQYSSNAAADYLLDRLAPVDWSALYATLQLYDTSEPNSLTMIPLLMNNHEAGRATEEDVDGMSTEQGEAYLDQYVNNAVWRQEEIAYRSQRVQFDRGSSSWPPWDVQGQILQQHTATGSVNDFRNVMTAIYSNDSPLSLNVQYMTRTALRWNDDSFINATYTEYGSKLGFYSGGVLALVAYGQPIAADPVISVIFLRNIPQDAYRTLLAEDSIGHFAHWLNFTACGHLDELLNALVQQPAA